MDASEALRTARRRLGVSQRGLAERAGVPASSVAAYESGARSPTAQVLQDLLAVAGVELTLTTRLPAPGEDLQAHLRLGLTPRLHQALGGSGNVRHDAPAAWTQLWELAKRYRAAVVGTAAVGLWAPMRAAPGPVGVRLGDHRTQTVPPEAVLAAPDLDLVAAGAAQGHGGGIPVVFRGRRVFVASPGELALDPTCAPWQTQLRVAARLLHDLGGADAAGRRGPAHRDPAHAAEAYRVFHTKRYGQRPMPTDAQLRSWRLDGPVGYREWLVRIGYPG